MENHFSYKDLAAMLGVSRSTIDRHMPKWIAEGKVSVVKIGRIFRVPESDATRLVDSLKIERVGI